MTKTPNESTEEYQHQEWPRWFTGPNGERQVFTCAEEVPYEWSDKTPAELAAEGDIRQQYEEKDGGEVKTQTPDEPATEDDDVKRLTEEEEAAKVKELVNNNSQADLAEMLEKMQELDDSIEFAANWPKVKLASLIVANGGPLED